MGVLVIDWQTYYDAAKKCHSLATDLRTADKPVRDAVKGECAGMAGDAPGCEQWGRAYDRAAQETMQTCTNLADALTHFGNMLYAAGYNWALANKSNPMPDRPTATAMSEYKVSIPTSVGSNGDGVTEGNGSIPGFYDALVGKIQDEFGSKLPNGNKDKLAKAASTWKTFAEHPTITGTPARITAISNLFDDIQDKKGLEALLGHLTTLNSGATQLAAASVNLAAPIGEYSEATADVRDKFKEAVTNALIAAGATVVIGVAASWITAALSNVAAGVGVLAIAGNTARVLKSTYDISKLIRIIGAAAAATGTAAFVVTAFDKVPSLTDIAVKLGAIIAMKVYIDDDGNPASEGDTSGAPSSAVTDEMARMLREGIHPGEDCSEIAEHLKKVAAGAGEILRVDPAPGQEVTVEEYGQREQFLYHEVYTDGKYVYDPRHSSNPIPIEQWRKTIMGDNPGATIKKVG
ncbi:hypothetical protein AB0M45_14600 [Nocardia sp. NPDC051787]|uniref:hypothetical protein n=1 Tax=Nocardia sp. NPDC051787 TaxID=3155415 RepID=UPI00342B1C97